MANVNQIQHLIDLSPRGVEAQPLYVLTPIATVACELPAVFLMAKRTQLLPSCVL
jgi:hypothetical protein